MWSTNTGIPMMKFIMLSVKAKTNPAPKEINILDLVQENSIPKERPTGPLVNRKNKPS